MRYFKDKNYRDSVVNYLNLIKYNFNIAHVINNLPHFNAMLLAAQEGNTYLENDVLGYKFISEVIPQLVEIASINEEITQYELLSSIKQSNKKYSNVNLNPNILEKAQDTLYEISLMD